jgi:exopolysaccharide biosynthesis polyprenyl glycosylphosphotransferase
MADRETKVLALRAEPVAASSRRLRRAHWAALEKLAYLAGDLLALTVAHMLAVRGVQYFLQVPLSHLNPSAYYRYYVPFCALVLYLFEGYKGAELRRPERELELGCKAVALVFLGLALFNFVVFKSQPFSRYLLVTWFALSAVLLVAVRFTHRAINTRLGKAGVGRRRTVLLGSPAGLADYLQLLSIQRYHGYELLGWIPDSAQSSRDAAEQFGLRRLGTLERWEEILAHADAELLVVASTPLMDGDGRLAQILQRSKQLRLDVEVYSDALANSDLHFERDEFSGCFRFYARAEWSLALQRGLKRAMDLGIGLIGSLATVLLTPVIGLLIKLQDSGPIFYRSAYLASGDRIRYYRKFRTMRADADEILQQDAELQSQFRAQQKLKDDPRVTPIGKLLRKTSLDEFPQFFSVLRGELTSVGPRTIREEEAERYGALLPKLLSVKPGVTGFWQVMGRQTTTYEERVQMDMFYIDHWSIWLDLVILGRTFWKVMRCEGAY